MERAIREFPLAASLLLVGLSLFFGGGPSDGSVFWLGGGALLATLMLLWTTGVPGGWHSVVPFALLAVWCAVSIAWSGLPDRSWDYANRACVYALLVGLGLWCAGRTRALANGLAVLVGGVIAWSLAGKVLPVVYDYGGPDVTRLRGPIGLWNQVALASVYGLVLSFAVRRRPGALLAYASLVALLLTYSRGGILTALLACAAWFLFSSDRVDSATRLVAALVPAAAVGGLAFALPGVTDDAQSSHVRWHDGIVFGVVLLVGAIATVALERLPRPRDERLVRRLVVAAGVVSVAAVVAFVAVHGIGSDAVGNGGQRLGSTSSNFRFTWWHQAWRGFLDHPLDGVGAGAFHLLNLRYRTTYLDFTTEPHDLPLQVLAELGVVGLVVLAVGFVLLLRPSFRRSGPELALALLLPTFLVHSLVDIDWDFVAVAAPALVAAGALAGRPAARRVGGFALLPAVGIAIAVFGVLLSPWLAHRWANDALFSASPARAITLANRAHALDPLLVDPYTAKAIAYDGMDQLRRAFAEYAAAVDRQPKNPETWRAAGQYAWDVLGCPYLAYTYLEKYTELDQKANPERGGDVYNEALRRVNNRQYRC